jgi:large subunit ribosomal protein L10
MNKNEKAEVVARLTEKVSKATAIYLTDFTGLNVEQETALRREFRKAGIEYLVTKNTFIRKAMEQAKGFDAVYSTLVGPTSIAFSYDEPSVPARIIKETGEKTGKLKLKAAIIEKHIYGGAQLDSLAKLPSRKDIIAGILGNIQAPASGIVGAINAVLRDLVGVVDATSEKKKAA